MDKKKIGLFDSGLGGLSILRALSQQAQSLEFFYIADQGVEGYGDKSPDFIVERSFHIVEILLSQGVDLIVVACNTATAHSIDLLRKNYPQVKFVGVEPYINALVQGKLHGKGLVLTTLGTYQSSRFEQLRKKCDPKNELDYFPAKGLATLVEQCLKHSERPSQEDLKFIFKGLGDKEYKNIILGCTHYPLIEAEISQYFSAPCLGPCEAVSQRACQLLCIEPSLKETCGSSPFQFFSTEDNTWQSMSLKDFHL
jgi:glutamate racemase